MWLWLVCPLLCYLASLIKLHQLQVLRVQAAAPTQSSARHARTTGASATHTPQPRQSTQPKASQQLTPTEPSAQTQPAQQICEAYDLDTFLKERDACGVRLRLEAQILVLQVDLSGVILNTVYAGGLHS